MDVEGDIAEYIETGQKKLPEIPVAHLAVVESNPRP